MVYLKFAVLYKTNFNIETNVYEYNMQMEKRSIC